MKIKTVKKSAMFLTGNTIVNIDTFTLEGLIARKLLAMMRRTEGKDFYDIWHSAQKLDHALLNKEINLLFRHENVKNAWPYELIGRIKDIKSNDLKKFNNYIPVDRRPDWELVKNDILLMLKSLKKF